MAQESVYIAGRFEQRAALRTFRAVLEDAGYIVVARWLDIPDESSALDGDEITKHLMAQMDLQDLLSCQILLACNIEPKNVSNRGGRHVEFGAALLNGMEIHTIGEEEHIFHHLNFVYRHVDISDFISFRKAWLDNGEKVPNQNPYGAFQVPLWYREFVAAFAQYPGANTKSLREIVHVGLAIASEAGELGDVIKKADRMGDPSDGASYTPYNHEPYYRHPDFRGKLILEMGDVLWYYTQLMRIFNITLDEVMHTNMAKLLSRQEKGTVKMR